MGIFIYLFINIQKFQLKGNEKGRKNICLQNTDIKKRKTHAFRTTDITGIGMGIYNYDF